MGSKFEPIFAALSEPFFEPELKTRTGAGRTYCYITARTAMNRLDVVVGPENWWDEYTAGENSVVCKLSIRLEDGVVLTKCDAGGHAGMADSGDDEKSAYSDAFKRACVKFGLGRGLYGDGVPAFGREDSPQTRPAEAAAAEPRKPPPSARQSSQTFAGDFQLPKAGKAVYAWAKAMESHYGITTTEGMGKKGHELGYGGNLTAWTQEQADIVCMDAVKYFRNLDNYQGEYDEVAPAKATEVKEKTVKQLIVEAATGLYKKMHGTDPRPDEVFMLVQSYAEASCDQEGLKGRRIESLSKCQDHKWLANILNLIQSDLKNFNAPPAVNPKPEPMAIAEANEEDDIPF